jgi:hypothetical protein
MTSSNEWVNSTGFSNQILADLLKLSLATGVPDDITSLNNATKKIYQAAAASSSYSSRINFLIRNNPTLRQLEN